MCQAETKPGWLGAWVEVGHGQLVNGIDGIPPVNTAVHIPKIQGLVHYPSPYLIPSKTSQLFIQLGCEIHHPSDAHEAQRLRGADHD